MVQCKRSDIQEKLAAALWPMDFPDEAGEIDTHVSQCPQCENELAQLRLLDKYMKDYKNELADAVSPCPSSEILVDFALGTQVDSSTEAHIDSCQDCKDHVTLVRDLSRQEFAPGHSSPTLEEKALIRELVSREYGLAEKPREEPARPGLFGRLRGWMHIPSLAVGAVSAAVLVAVLLRETGPKNALYPALSGVEWTTSHQTRNKYPLTLMAPKPTPKEKVALVLFVSHRSGVDQSKVDEIYRGMRLTARLSTSYEFMSPKKLKEMLAGAGEQADLNHVKTLVLQNAEARFLLAFAISSTETGQAFRGTLYQRGKEGAVCTIERTGLPTGSIAARINAAASELLADAEMKSLDPQSDTHR